MSSPHILQRSELDPQSTWNLRDIFIDDDAWERAFADAKALLDEVPRHKGRLGASADALLDWLKAHDRLTVAVGLLSNYAYRKYDEDTRVPAAQALMDRAIMLEAEYGAAVSWVLPEVLSLPDGRVDAFVRENAELGAYRHDLANTLRMRPHALTTGEEELLARSQEVLGAPANIFGMFNDADITFGSVTDTDGQSIEVTKGRYISLQESNDRRLREDAFRALYGAYAQWKNTLAALLGAQVKSRIFEARARRFASSRDAALFRDNIPAPVYDTLIATVRAHLTPLHRSISLRKRVLGIDTVQPWDLYVSLATDSRREYAFAEARAMVIDGLRPLGETYATNLRTAFSERWIDVHETAGKASGAYSAWTYGAHPYILLNYSGTLKDVFTLAHELGHAMHSWYTWKSQPPVYGNYSIFCAEVASTCNEMLLMHHLLSRLQERDLRLQLLMHFIETIRGTLYNQVLFAEFEMTIHQQAESGGALTAEAMSAAMDELYRAYYGDAATVDPLLALNWSRVPHFYRSFYVFQYATGLSAAIALSQGLLDGDADALARYLGFLSAGSSGYSIDLLAAAGVDMTTTRPVEAAAALMSELLDQAEELL
jgi:oligoendopeptidase F